jgi:6-phosphogluconolactonase (cycloisomerase 2 family)
MFVLGRGARPTLRLLRCHALQRIASTERTLPPSTGPRHITFRTFNCTRTYMYLVGELYNILRVFTLDGVSNLTCDTPATGTPKLEVTLQR